MAHVTHSQDEKPKAVDETLDRVAATSGNVDRSIRCRLQPDLYDPAQTSYRAWTGLVWMVELQDAAEGRRLREGLADFFKVFGGTEKQQGAMLAELRKRAGR